MTEIDRLNDQRYNTELLYKRIQVANNMLSKQLEESEQCL